MAAQRSILITGGTVNMGYYTALNIARKRQEDIVVIASRSNKDDAANSINKTLGQSNVQYMSLDLGDFSNIRSFAQNWAIKVSLI